MTAASTGVRPTPTEAVEDSFARIEADGRHGVWIELVDRARARAAAAEVERRVAKGEPLPLAGLTAAVKGNIDVAGLATTAGCPAFGSAPATRSAAAVRALEVAGAVVVGVTNLDQFATGLVGTRSPYGICPNAHWPGLVSGGSSSGSAVAVAAGLVDIGVGTDTAGSGRVPAAANGIVGLKPTRGRVSAAGVVPACRSLDCVSFFATTVDLAALAADVAAGFDPADPWSRHQVHPAAGDAGSVRFGIPGADSLVLKGAVSPSLFRRCVNTIAAAGGGGEVVDIDLDPFVAAGRLLYEGAFVAERYAAVGEFVSTHPGDVDPIVGGIIMAAAELPAWRLAADRTSLEQLRRQTEATWTEVDVIAVPTVPRVPTVTEVLADPIGVNTELGTYTNFVNLLDLCALTIPVGDELDGHPPASVTLVAPAWADDLLVTIGRRAMCGTPASRPRR